MRDLDEAGVTDPTKLALLAALLYESPGSGLGPISTSHAEALLERLRDGLYHSFVAVAVPELHTSASCDDDTMSYRVELLAPNLTLRSCMSVSVDNAEAALLGHLDGDDLRFHITCDLGDDFDVFGDLRALLETLSDRRKRALTARCGIDRPKPLTLQELGYLLGVTRGRAFQIEAGALSRLQTASSLARTRRLSTTVESIARLLNTPPDDQLVAQEIERRFPTAEPALPWLRLLAGINGKGWAQPAGQSTPEAINDVKVAVVSILARYGTMPMEELKARVAQACSRPDDARLEAYMRTSAAYGVDVNGMCELPGVLIPGIRDKQLRRLYTMIGIIERDGPSHFTHIAGELNARVIPACKMSERDVHTWLGRFTDHFIWAGPGIYALPHQGVGIRADVAPDEVQLPDEYRKRRRKGIGDEIVALLLEQGPLTLEEIEAHILARFYVNHYSVEAAIWQDKARRFIVDDNGSIRLRNIGAAPPDHASRKVRVVDEAIASSMPRTYILRDEVRRHLSRLRALPGWMVRARSPHDNTG